MRKLKLTDYDYDLPQKLIAQYPAPKRVDSRLMVLDRKSGEISTDYFYNIIKYIDDSYFLVMNETEVIPARLYGKKPTGGKAEILLLTQISANKWKCLVKPGRRLKSGSRIIFGNGVLVGRIIKHLERGERMVEFEYEGDFFDILDQIGHIPLPPYITRELKNSDSKRYQTVFAENKGSVAAPTAGLHFDKELLTKMHNMGIAKASVNLKIGLDTFRPVEVENILDHKMHSEFCGITKGNARKINLAKTGGKNILAVGTTAVRTLESYSHRGEVKAGEQWTDIFIYPGYEFKLVDALLTNFHLPKSTLLMLVSAFAGYDFIMNAYKKAVREEFRFFSYGDAMLIL